MVQAGTSSTTVSSSLPSPANVELGMGQFAFPGAPARPGPAQSPSLPLPFSDISYFSLLSLSQQQHRTSTNGGGGGGAMISSVSPQGDLPSPTVPHLLSPQALQELQLYRQAATSPRASRHRGPAPSSSGGAGSRGRVSRTNVAAGGVESASETLLNFAQQVGEVGAAAAVHAAAVAAAAAAAAASAVSPQTHS